MNKKQEKAFAELINKTEDCKVKFKLENCGWATYEGGDCREILTWAVFFDGNLITQNDPCFYSSDGKPLDPKEDLSTCVRDYISWSSHRIKELEAKLALSKVFSDEQNEPTEQKQSQVFSRESTLNRDIDAMLAVEAFLDSKLVLDPTAATTARELYDAYLGYAMDKKKEKVLTVVQFSRLLAYLLAHNYGVEVFFQPPPAQQHIAYFKGLRLRERQLSIYT